MSKTKLFGLLALGASTIGLVGTTVKLIQKNKELEDAEYWKNFAIVKRDEMKEELQEKTENFNKLLDLMEKRNEQFNQIDSMLDESHEQYDRLQENFDKVCSVADYWKDKYEQQKQENEELKLK